MENDALDPTSTVSVSVSCRDLLDRDLFSRSDPFTVVYNSCDDQWIEILRTETISDSLNPDFSQKLVIDYRFEEEQPMRFEVYDRDSDSTDLGDHSFLGFAEVNLSQIVSKGYDGLELPLSVNRSTVYFQAAQAPKINRGKLLLICEELSHVKEGVTLEVCGFDLGWSLCPCVLPIKVFFTLSKAVEEIGGFFLLHRTEAIEGPNPKWPPIQTTMASLCSGDRDREIQLQFFQEGFNGYHSNLGTFTTTVDKMLGTASSQEYLHLTGTNGKEKNSRIKFLQFALEPIYTFLEYIQKGTSIHCCFAIDFTASNLEPNDPNSLHNFSVVADKANPYEQAILAVGEIVQDYDSAKEFPVYGFGAKIPPKGDLSHKFFVSLTDTAYLDGIEGVLQGYRDCIRKVTLAGPTNFAPIISEVASLAETNQNGRHYYILLMITDGRIDDMPETKEAIVKASNLPLSIIIVGVGSANFSQMTVLDGDIVRLSSNGVFAERDIVQFIGYRDSQSWMAAVCPEVVGSWSSSYDQTNRLAKMKLAQEVLAEIPEQLTSYMKSRSIIPGKVS